MLGLVVLFLVSLGVLFTSNVLAAPCAVGDTACSRPYFKGTGSDIGTGGWFDTGSTTCTTPPQVNNYQDANYTPPAGSSNSRYGGILAFANPSGSNSAGGSSSEFAAFALGLIEGGDVAANNFGFYSAGSQAKNGPTSLGYSSFANTVNTPWGGLLVPAGQARQTTFCIPDYYTLKKPAPADCDTLPGGHLNNGAPSRAYCATAGSPLELVRNSVTLNPGQKVTVFVDGSVYITHNITYTGGTNVDNVPKFSLIVRGSIYIDPSVTELYGLYIAQPNPADPNPVANDTGDIWTCHPGTPGPVNYTFFAACTPQLRIRGAFIAKRIDMMRVNGNVVSASTSEDGFTNALASPNTAEVINFSPDMVVGGPFFTDDSSTDNDPKIDSLISLPPVF